MCVAKIIYLRHLVSHIWATLAAKNKEVNQNWRDQHVGPGPKEKKKYMQEMISSL